MKYDLAVKDGTVITSRGAMRATLVVSNGKIAGFLSPDVSVNADTVVDARDLWVLPGMVDMHVHMNERAGERNEDIDSGTRAAAAGGVTTTVVMPDGDHPVIDEKSLRDRAKHFDRKSYIDFALVGGTGGAALDHINEQATAGVVGFASHIDPDVQKYGGLTCTNSAEIYAVFERVAQTGRFIGFYAEDSNLNELFTSRLLESERVSAADFAASRPEFAEVVPTLELLELAEVTGVHLHLMRCSSPRAISLAGIYRDEGTKVTVDTCPHYLFFNEEDVEQLGESALVDPPLRSEASRDDLWDLLMDGYIDIISTDHAAIYEKEQEHVQHSFFPAVGLSSLEVVYPTFIDRALSGDLAPESVAWFLSESPARAAGLSPQKGNLEVGADADMVIVDPEGLTELNIDHMHTAISERARLYDGLELGGKIEKVFCRGELISEAEEIKAEPGRGRWIIPEEADPGD